MHLPRLAVGTVQPGVDSQAMLWALLTVLERRGPHVQTFLSQARFQPHNGALPITGQEPRHLDSWLMSPEMCRALFVRGMSDCDVALVEGHFESPTHRSNRATASPAATGDSNTASNQANLAGGHLDTLCHWLNLPRVAIVNVDGLDRCQLPPRIPHLDGILLDGTSGGDSTGTWKDCDQIWRTNLETMWQAPVVGRLPVVPRLRTLVDGLPPGATPSDELCDALGSALERTLNLDLLMKLAERRPFDFPIADLCDRCACRRLQVAVAYDESFNCYFQDTLDLLEVQGAQVEVFSPLTDVALPAGTDLVYLGCGHAYRFAERLARNCCLRQDMQRFAARGGRIYAEGSGLAYLCEQMILADGRSFPMSGVLPGVARRCGEDSGPVPVELELGDSCWLGSSGSRLLGYRSSGWEFQYHGSVARLAGGAGEAELIGRQAAIGSNVHLNFAAQPSYLSHFFCPVQSARIPAINP